MALKGIINTGSTVVITHEAHNTNTGSSALLSGYVPDAGDVQVKTIAPGTNDSNTHEDIPPPSIALQLRIFVDVPDPTSTGKLIVVEDGVVLNEEEITNDTVWTYIIQ